MRVRFWCAAAATAVCLSASSAQAQPEVVRLITADDVLLTASLWTPPRTPAPAIVLLHMLGRSRTDWDETARRLREAGFVVLVPDFRRMDGSGAADRSASLMPLQHDVRAALAFVRARPELATGQVGLAGASLGASVAAIIAADDPAVRGLALVSPALDYRGLRCEAAMRKYGDRPALLLAAHGDPYAVRSAKQLATGGNRELLISESGGHGTRLLARRPELVEHLVEWFRRTLL